MDFVRRLVERIESNHFRAGTCIGACLLIGRKKSVTPICKLLKKSGAKVETEKMKQGTKTRYFIGWTFQGTDMFFNSAIS